MRSKDNNFEDPNDNVVYVNGPEEARINNQDIQRRVAKQKRLMILFAILFAVMVCGLFFFITNRTYHGYKVIENNEANYENTARYVQFSGNLLKYTPDGVSYINSNGDTVWTAGVDMKMPIVATCGKYAVVADLNGNAVSIFSTEGQESALTMPYTICDVDVAEQGAFVVILESDKTNYTNLYDKTGKVIYEIQTTINKSGYPLDVALSNDGKKLFSSYVKVGGTTVQNQLVAHNFGDVGQNANADRVVGGYTFDDQVVVKTEFINNDTVATFGTKQITTYSMREKPSEKGKITFDEEIRSVFYSEDYIGVVQETGDPERKYKISAYDTDGDKKFQEYIEFEYDNIYCTNKEIIVTGGTNCKIFRTNGTVKFSAELSDKIVGIVPNGKYHEYIVVYNNKTEVIKIKLDKNVSDENVNNENANDEKGSGDKRNDSSVPEITSEEMLKSEEATEEVTEGVTEEVTEAMPEEASDSEETTEPTE